MEEDPVGDARLMFRMRPPGEVLENEGWRFLDDESVRARIFNLPNVRAIDISKDLKLPDGRVVRFRVQRHGRFDDMEVRNDHGQLDGAAAHCNACGAYRLLQVPMVCGGLSLRCPFCSTREAEELDRGKPI